MHGMHKPKSQHIKWIAWLTSKTVAKEQHNIGLNSQLCDITPEIEVLLQMSTWSESPLQACDTHLSKWLKMPKHDNMVFIILDNNANGKPKHNVKTLYQALVSN